MDAGGARSDGGGGTGWRAGAEPGTVLPSVKSQHRLGRWLLPFAPAMVGNWAPGPVCGSSDGPGPTVQPCHSAAGSSSGAWHLDPRQAAPWKKQLAQPRRAQCSEDHSPSLVWLIRRGARRRFSVTPACVSRGHTPQGIHECGDLQIPWQAGYCQSSEVSNTGRLRQPGLRPTWGAGGSTVSRSPRTPPGSRPQGLTLLDALLVLWHLKSV